MHVVAIIQARMGETRLSGNKMSMVREEKVTGFMYRTCFNCGGLGGRIISEYGGHGLPHKN